MTRVLAIVDGEHYPSVVRDALDELPYEVVGALLVGGIEKLRGDGAYGVPLAHDLEQALTDHEPELVIDLSDEPVLGPRERLRLASRVLAHGIPYAGADFRFDPPALEPCPRPSISVVGTGKRVGKTAVTGHLARMLARRGRVVVVSMGRGGPAEPELCVEPPSPQGLLELSRSGAHAASDYLETAALVGVPTVGCRRCGGGLSGATTTSNVPAGIDLALTLDPEVLLFDGSGAALPPVATDRRVLVARDAEDAVSFLNAYRVLMSDLVLLTGGSASEPIRRLKDVPVVPITLRLRPEQPLDGRRVAVFTTGPAPVEHLDAQIVLVSRNLADRPALRRDLARVDAEVYLVEVKAAAIDVVCEVAAERCVEVVFAGNDVLPRDGGPELEMRLAALADGVTAAAVAP